MVVQKFGGTSVCDVQHIAAVAARIAARRNEGQQVVVVSAMDGETDRLLELAEALARPPPPRELDALLSTGELVSSALLAIALEKAGCPACSLTGAQAGIRTEQRHGRARIRSIDTQPIQALLEQGRIPVVAGFQGMEDGGAVTTLGRGGSDTTAVALAAALEAGECRVYTDVEGVYTADPRIVPQARRIARLSYEEMLELSSLGAKVLHNRAVECAGKYNISLRVLSSSREGPGTLIAGEGRNMEQPLITGIAHNQDEAKLTVIGVPDHPGIAHDVLGPIAEAGIEVDMIVQNIGEQQLTDLTFTVHRRDYSQAREILGATARRLKARGVRGDPCIVKLSIVGVGMRSHAGIASRMFQALAQEGINIMMISTSEIKISVVVDEKYLELGVRAMHSVFGLDKEGFATTLIPETASRSSPAAPPGT